MYEIAKAEGREGIVLKRMDYSYATGRSSRWLKLKFFKEAEFEAIKYTENPSGIRVEDKDGNSCQIQKEWRDEDKINVIKNLIDKEGKAIILIQYLNKTEDGRYRFPSFRGLKTGEQLKSL